MAARNAFDNDDVVVSKVQNGHLLWIVTPDRSDRLSLMNRENDCDMSSMPWQEASRLVGGRAASLYTSDETGTLEYLGTFRAIRPPGDARVPR